MRRAAAGALVLMLVLPLGMAVRAQDDPAAMYGFDEGGDDGGGGGGLEFRWGGKIQSDLRWRLTSDSIGAFYQEMHLEDGIARNENIVGFKAEALVGDIVGVIEVDFVWVGIPDEVSGIGDLSLREKIEPFRLEAHAAYVEVYDFLLEGMDLRIGQQLVLWGKADQFNPTNTINANDVEDPLLLGEQRANLMVRLDYNFWDQWTVSGVMVPIFKPALLPDTAVLGLMFNDRIPVANDALRYRLHTEKVLAEHYFDFPTVTSAVTPYLPETSTENMQFAFRVSGAVLEQDIAFSYYRGRSDRPQAFENYTTQHPGVACDPADATKCVDGLLQTESKLLYPKVEVFGFNIAGEIPLGKINPLGYRLELGVYLPQRSNIRLYQETIDFTVLKYNEGEYDYDLDGQPGGPERPAVVKSTPFAKWTLGLDYTLGRHVMLIAMWMHGLFDEFGAGDWLNGNNGWEVRKGWATTTPDEVFACVASEQLWVVDHSWGERCPYQQHAAEILRPKIGDYLMLGLDIKFADDRALLRLVGVFDLIGVYEEKWVWNDPNDERLGGRRKRTHHGMFTDKGFSASLFPEFNYNLGDGLDLGIGGLINLGKQWSKFGEPAAGGSMVWTRARFQYELVSMNAVLVIIDSLRQDHVGAYGNDKIVTPNLDALATQSARFTRMHPESLPTLPARRSIYTGTRTFPFAEHQMLRGDFAGIAPGWGPIEEDRDTLAEILQMYGYRTALVSDVYHMFKPSKNFHRGFDEWTWIRGQEDDPYRSGPALQPEEELRFKPENLESEFHLPMLIQKYVHNTRARTREEDYFPAQVFSSAVDWLQANQDAKKFFLTVECFDPHEPWDPPLEYRRLYDDEEVEGLREVIFSLYGPSAHFTDRELQRMRANYAGEVTLVDRWFGRLLDALRDLGKLDDTVVLVVTDHGHCIGEHGLVSKQGYPMSREIADLVMLLRRPGGAGAGEACDALCMHHDIPVTLLSELGIDPPQRMTGHDLRAMVTGERPYDHVTTGWGPFVMVRDERWWYNAYLWGEGPRLFDVEADPGLLHDVADAHPAEVQRLAALALQDAGGVIPEYLREVAKMNLPGCTPLVANL